jgi:CelD/BcsL family acetyltransferase involved in cellulose biosynthesis
MPAETIRTIEALEALTPEWEALWRRSPQATPFQSPHFLLPWWHRFGIGGEVSTVAVRNDADGRLDALAPLYILRDDDTGESLGLFLGTGTCDYLDALAADAASAATLTAGLAAADCMLWDLQQLRPSSPLLSSPLPDGWSENVEDHDRCPVLSLEGAGADLSGLVSTHFRKKLRYYRRSLEREGPVTYEAANAETLDELLAALYELHAARWQQRGLPGVLADDVIRDFHGDAAPRLLNAGALRMYAIRVADRIVAVFYGFGHQGTTYYYLSGYDPSLEKLSLGTILVAHAIEQAVAGGDTTFDFLRGAEEYKYAWGASDRMNRRRQLIRNMDS